MAKPLPAGSPKAGKGGLSDSLKGRQPSGPLPKRPSLPKSLTGTGALGKVASAATPLGVAGKAVKGLKSAASGAGKLASPEGRADLGKATLAKGKAAALKMAKGAAKLTAKVGFKVLKKAALACVASGVCLIVVLIIVLLLGAFTIVGGSLLMSDEDDTNSGSASSTSSTSSASGGANSPDADYQEEFGIAAGNPESRNLLAIILDHWRLDSSENTEPVSLLERWLIGGREVDDSYRLHTGATEKEPCESLWDSYTPTSDDTLNLDPFDETLWNPALCERVWAAAVAWDHIIRELGISEGLLQLGTDVTFPIKVAIQKHGYIYPWLGASPEEPPASNASDTSSQIPDSEVPGILAVALWLGSGFGTIEDESDGFALVFFDETDEHDAPYCGLREHYLNDNEADDYDERVLLPVECLEPPSTDVCTDLFTGRSSANIQRLDLQPASDADHDSADESIPEGDIGSSGIPHCEEALQVETDFHEDWLDGEPPPPPPGTESDPWRGPSWAPRRYQWQTLWWRDSTDAPEVTDRNTYVWTGSSWVISNQNVAINDLNPLNIGRLVGMGGNWARLVWDVPPVCDDTSGQHLEEHAEEKWVMSFCADIVWIEVIYSLQMLEPFFIEHIAPRQLPMPDWSWSPLRPVPPTFGPLLSGVLSPFSDREINEQVAWRTFAAADAYGWEPTGISDIQKEARSALPEEGENKCARLWLVLELGMELTEGDFCPLRTDVDSAVMNSWGWRLPTDSDLANISAGRMDRVGGYNPNCDAPTPVTAEDVVQTVTVVVKVPDGNDSTVSIVVAPCLEESIKGLWREAYWSGVVLKASSYRSFQTQVQKRIACGLTGLAILTASSRACHPPLAIPGQSRHQMGLAIDFHGCSNAVCPIFDWLRTHARDYGLKNFPLEKWHWSVDGK